MGFYRAMKNLRSEIWKPVKDYEGLYEVSSLSRIRSLPRWVRCKGGTTRLFPGRVLIQSINKESGYYFLNLSKNGKAKGFRVHRLVAIAFLPEVVGKVFVNHKDGVKTHNLPSNLEWCTMMENLDHAQRTGLAHYPKGELHAHKLSQEDVIAIRKAYIPDKMSYSMLGRKYGVSPSTITRLMRGDSWSWLDGGKKNIFTRKEVLAIIGEDKKKPEKAYSIMGHKDITKSEHLWIEGYNQAKREQRELLKDE